MGQDSGSDPEEAFLADEVEGVIEGHDGAEGSGWSPGLAAPPEDFDLVAVAGWAQAGDRCAGLVAEERAAAPGAAGLDSAPGPGMGLDAVEQGVGLGHDDLHGAGLLEQTLQPPGGDHGPSRPAAARRVLPLAGTGAGRLLAALPGAGRCSGGGRPSGDRPAHRDQHPARAGSCRAGRLQHVPRVLSRNTWSGLALARPLTRALVRVFAPAGPVVVGLDHTLERRRGPKVRPAAHYYDPVRSSRGRTVTTRGLRWASVMLLGEVPFVRRVWALPMLSALIPGKAFC